MPGGQTKFAQFDQGINYNIYSSTKDIDNHKDKIRHVHAEVNLFNSVLTLAQTF